MVTENLEGWRENSIDEAIEADCRENKTSKVEKESDPTDEEIAANCSEHDKIKIEKGSPSADEAIAADGRECKSTKIENESDAKIEIRVEDVDIDIEKDKSDTTVEPSDDRSDECIAGLHSSPSKSDDGLHSTKEIRAIEREAIVNNIAVHREAEITFAPNLSPFSVASQDQNNLHHTNNADNEIDSAELKSKVALYDYYSIAILKDALLTLKGNICTERIIKDSKNRSDHLKSPRKVFREASVTNKSIIQKMEDFAAKVGKDILQESIADSGKLTAIRHGTQTGPKHETGNNATQSMSASNGSTTVDVSVSEKCFHDNDLMKVVPSYKTVKGEFSASREEIFEMLPQQSNPDLQQKFSDEMENIAYLVVSSVIKDAISKYLKTNREIVKFANDSSENLAGSARPKMERPSTLQGDRLNATTQGRRAADTGSAELTDNEQAKLGHGGEEKNPSRFQCGHSPCAVEPTKTLKVEYGGYSGLIPGNNNVVPQNDKATSRNVCTLSRSEAMLLSTNKQIVANPDQKNMMLTQESQFTSFLDRMANNVISQGVTVAVVQIQRPSGCQQQRFEMRANKEGIATEEELLNEGQSNSFEGCVAKQTEKLDVLGWFAERLISQLLEK